MDDYAKAIGDLPLEFVFDAISEKETQILGVKILQAASTTASRVVTVQATSQEAQELGQSKEPKVAVTNVLGLGSAPHLRYLSEPMAKVLGGEDGWVAKGLLVPNRVSVVPGGLDSLDEALKKNKQGVSGFKIIIKPSE